MKIYTKTGDKGETNLFDGVRIEKNHPRVEAYGHIDELDSALGMLVSLLSDDFELIRNELVAIQQLLFLSASWFATSPDSKEINLLQEMLDTSTEPLEEAIDRMQSDLEPLTGFIVPGGVQAAAWAHVARTICRRTERRLILVLPDQGESKSAEQSRIVIKYINRLSDYLYTLARFINFKSGISDKKKQV